MIQPIVVFGLGSLGRLARYYLEHDGHHKVVAFSVHEHFVTSSKFDDLPLVPFEELTDRFPPGEFGVFLSIGYRNMRNRRKLFEELKSKGYRLVNYISSHAVTFADTLEIGENNLVMPGAIIEPFSTLGDNNIIGPHSLLSHYVRLGSHNYLGGRVVIAGINRVGDLCFFGNSATTINNIVVADETQVMPGATIFKDTLAHTKYMGSPAKAVGIHKDDGIVIEGA